MGFNSGFKGLIKHGENLGVDLYSSGNFHKKGRRWAEGFRQQVMTGIFGPKSGGCQSIRNVYSIIRV